MKIRIVHPLIMVTSPTRLQRVWVVLRWLALSSFVLGLSFFGNVGGDMGAEGRRAGCCYSWAWLGTGGARSALWMGPWGW